MTGRRRYRDLSRKPAWALYSGQLLIASCRAETAEDAHNLFHRYGLKGDRVIQRINGEEPRRNH